MDPSNDYPIVACHGWYFILGLMALLATIGAGCAQSEPTRIGKSTNRYCDTTLCCEDCPATSVSRIVDGDTFITGQGQRVRLYGADTPERGERCFSEATNRLRELAGAAVRVETGPRLRDPGDRLLYYVYTEDGESIDEKLIREGFAHAWTRDGQHRDTLVNLERKARREGSGCLW